jgi:hypothetical protein
MGFWWRIFATATQSHFFTIFVTRCVDFLFFEDFDCIGILGPGNVVDFVVHEFL